MWRCFLPVLPGPREPDERIAPFAGYFTDPLTAPLVRLRVPAWVAALLLLIADAAALVAWPAPADATPSTSSCCSGRLRSRPSYESSATAR